MEEINYKFLQDAATRERWKKLSKDNTWESHLQLCDEKLDLFYDDLRKHTLYENFETPEYRKSLHELSGNGVISCINLLELIKKLDFEVTRGFYENEAIESKNYEQIKALQEEAKLLKERIKKLEAK